MSGFAMVAAGILAAVLGVLALIHVGWALGDRWGASGAVPEVDGRPAFVPGRGATLLVAAGLWAAAGLVLWRAGWIEPGGPEWLPRAGTWGLAVAFAARAVGEFRLVGFFKTIRGSRFARLDDRIYSPLCLALSLLALVVAAS